MVVNISKVLSGDWDYVRRDIGAVVDVHARGGDKVKVIFENCYLQGRAQDPPLRDLRRGRRRLGEDVHRLRHRRGHARRPAPDAQARAAARAGEGGRRRPHLDALLEVRALGVTRSAPHAQRKSSRSASGGSRRIAWGSLCGPPRPLPGSSGIGVMTTPSPLSKLQVLMVPSFSFTSQTLRGTDSRPSQTHRMVTSPNMTSL